MPAGGAVRGRRGVLFDSGGTLVRPVGGRWNPRHDFEAVVLAHHPDIPADALPAAFAAGEAVLAAGSATVPRADYHRTILRSLGVERPSPTLLAELEAPLSVPPVEPFPEVPRVLDRLRAQGVRMAIVSDNWPGLEDLYRNLGLDRYFDCFVVSAVLGCRKPDPRMYRAGSDGLDLAPPECLFVDDDPRLVAAAIDLGYHGVAILRAPHPPVPVPSISTLAALDPFLAP